jgi:REP element-mobilizing transposase RayT
VDAYLSEQGEHHGYSQRLLPPVYVQTFAVDPATEASLQAHHAFTILRFHLVIATWRRHSVFGSEEGQAMAECWRQLERAEHFALLKVSFVPDHVHVAVQTHPGISPASLVVLLMNSAQRLVWERFQASAIQARIERLWQPSAYVGSFGDWATHYVRNWRDRLKQR